MIFRQKNSCSNEHGKLCFGAPEIISGTPKQLAARLKARDGLHSKVVTPESGKRGIKIWKMTAMIYRPALKQRPLLKKRMNFIRVINLLQAVFFHLTVLYSEFIFSNNIAYLGYPLHI
ncbi:MULTISPECIES: hypothetical protein [Bacteroidaceae]|uniref:hypothetical protein n=1 Tax=Bacteroidaceae TaxID=815 RepID=UPI0011C15683|nr:MULTISPECIES: hypothetical protein [Bacteroides]MCS3218060.1 hypothetical protein [Bacteroides thetaiotaomicron]